MFDMYEFDWDDDKAAANLSKHGVSFAAAMSVFFDPLAMTRYDDEHSEAETRWVTLGQGQGGALLLVVHTYTILGADRARVRLIPRDARPGVRRSSITVKTAAGARSERLAMKDEYDFTGAERGKFYRPNLKLVPPVHLDPDVLDYLEERAKAKGTTLSSLVNQLLKKDIELIEAGG